MESVAARIEDRNADLNAITVDLREQQLRQATAADEAVVRGDALGALHGVPVTIKENVDMAGLATPNGIPAFADLMATEDAPVVRNLRNAGAIVVGRTNVPEFSMRATTDNPLRGRTFNPWTRRRRPGALRGAPGLRRSPASGRCTTATTSVGRFAFRHPNSVRTVKPTTFRVPVFNSTAAAERGPLSQECRAKASSPGMRVMSDWALRCSSLRIRETQLPAGSVERSVARQADHGGGDDESAGYDIHPEVVASIRSRPTCCPMPGTGWSKRSRHQSSIRPVNGSVPEPRDAATLDPLIRQHGSETIQTIFDWYYGMGEILGRDDYINGFGHRTRLMRQWNLFLAEHPLVLTPFLMRPLFDWDYDARSFETTKDIFDASIYSTGINYIGLPAGVLATTMIESRPSAVQIVGQRYRKISSSTPWRPSSPGSARWPPSSGHELADHEQVLLARVRRSPIA